VAALVVHEMERRVALSVAVMAQDDLHGAHSKSFKSIPLTLYFSILRR
jgi:hypothetical protein